MTAETQTKAAAFELLEACQLVVGSLRFDREDDELNKEVLRRVKAAIAKATTHDR